VRGVKVAEGAGKEAGDCAAVRGLEAVKAPCARV